MARKINPYRHAENHMQKAAWHHGEAMKHMKMSGNEEQPVKEHTEGNKGIKKKRMGRPPSKKK